jgi:alpha-L-rhamnosidase
MVKEGATACFEAWGKEQKWNTSLCHPWASAPVLSIIEDIAGLKPGLPGWKEIIFKPHFPGTLKKLRLNVPVNTGNIKVVYDEGKTELYVPKGIPVKCSSSVKVKYL